MSSWTNSLSTTTWYGVEFLCYICIIAYVLDYFGLIKASRQTKNVVEQTTNTWANTGELLANATEIAKKVNSAFSQQQAPAEQPTAAAVAPQKAKK